MIGKQIQDNNDKKPNSREMDKLKDQFPQFFSKEGSFRLDKFQDFLKEEEVDVSKEGYELDFLGKSYAKYQSSLETETYIAPDLDHNNEEINKNSENLYIVGDNIDALSHLLKSYSGKIKCIYIDPPYNTGSDGFVYPDNFQFNKKEMSDKLGITEEEAERILDIAGKSTHSAWLTFMYPRLVLARDLLSDDGVIFISIDDNEQSNLKLICDEIYREENFVGNIHWESKTKSQNTKTSFNKLQLKCENIFVYKRKTKDRFNLIVKDKKEYPFKDKNGSYREHELEVMNSEGIRGRKTMIYDISDGVSTVSLEQGKQWQLGRDQVATFKERGDLKIKDGKVIINLRPEDERNEITEPFWAFMSKKIGTTESAKSNLKKMFNNKEVFDTVKPTELIKRLIYHSTDKNDTVLDFFSGSATSAHATMEQNSEDFANRKYIMVQLPEKIEKNKPAYDSGYRTIDEIGRMRIKLAAKKIKNETKVDIDYGFKLFYLEEPKEAVFDKLETFVPEFKLISDDMVSVFDNEHSSGKEAILATWINEDGYGLSRQSKTYKLNDYEANLMDDSLYLIDEGIKSEDIMLLVKQIEEGSLEINRVVIYVHSFDYKLITEIRNNIKVLKNKDVSLIERF